MSTVMISGPSIRLWCWVQGSTSITDITIGRNNHISEIKKIVKKTREPEFDNFASDRLKLLKLKNPVDDRHISDIQNFTLQVDEEENDNVILMKDMRKIATYWPENQIPPEDLIHVIIEAPDLAADKRKYDEYHIITTEGPLHPHQGLLMLPIHERDIFKVVKSGFLRGKSFIIHGPYQSGKSTFLLELRETLRCKRKLDYVHFSMPSIQGATLANKREGFFRFMSYILFKETLNETATFRRIFDLDKPLYLLIDEFQYIFTNSELCDVAKYFFREISNAEVYYVAVGTFILVDLMKNDGEFIAPFNKAKFEKMPLFSIKEMDKLFESYQFSMNKNGIQPDLRVEIIKESCGHPASFMILLKLYHDNLPNILQWEKVLQANFSQYMNGTHIALQNKISKMSINEKRQKIT
ncbi:unnamed protein product [Rhizophagus irregularis]|nr:unnamed protein product [Rhizophagus irregularis]